VVACIIIIQSTHIPTKCQAAADDYSVNNLIGYNNDMMIYSHPKHHDNCNMMFTECVYTVYCQIALIASCTPDRKT
jgi:hypothetical protein